MTDELQRVIHRHRTSTTVLAVTFVCGLALVVGGARFGWYVWSEGTWSMFPVPASLFWDGDWLRWRREPPCGHQ